MTPLSISFYTCSQLIFWVAKRDLFTERRETVLYEGWKQSFYLPVYIINFGLQAGQCFSYWNQNLVTCPIVTALICQFDIQASNLGSQFLFIYLLRQRYQFTTHWREKDLFLKTIEFTFVSGVNVLYVDIFKILYMCIYINVIFIFILFTLLHNEFRSYIHVTVYETLWVFNTTNSHNIISW